MVVQINVKAKSDQRASEHLIDFVSFESGDDASLSSRNDIGKLERNPILSIPCCMIEGKFFCSPVRCRMPHPPLASSIRPACSADAQIDESPR